MSRRIVTTTQKNLLTCEPIFTVRNKQIIDEEGILFLVSSNSDTAVMIPTIPALALRVFLSWVTKNN